MRVFCGCHNLRVTKSGSNAFYACAKHWKPIGVRNACVLLRGTHTQWSNTVSVRERERGRFRDWINAFANLVFLLISPYGISQRHWTTRTTEHVKMDSGKAILMLPAQVGIKSGSPVSQARINPLSQTLALSAFHFIFWFNVAFSQREFRDRYPLF